MNSTDAVLPPRSHMKQQTSQAASIASATTTRSPNFTSRKPACAHRVTRKMPITTSMFLQLPILSCVNPGRALRSQHAPSKSTPRSHPTSPVISQQSMVLSANAATSRASRTVLPGHAPWTSSARSKSTLSSALHAAIARFTVPPAQRISTRPTVRSFFPSKAPTNNDQPCRTQPHSRARSIIERKASPSSNTFRSQRRHHGR